MGCNKFKVLIKNVGSVSITIEGEGKKVSKRREKVIFSKRRIHSILWSLLFLIGLNKIWIFEKLEWKQTESLYKNDFNFSSSFQTNDKR